MTFTKVKQRPWKPKVTLEMRFLYTLSEERVPMEIKRDLASRSSEFQEKNRTQTKLNLESWTALLSSVTRFARKRVIRLQMPIRGMHSHLCSTKVIHSVLNFGPRNASRVPATSIFKLTLLLFFSDHQVQNRHGPLNDGISMSKTAEEMMDMTH